MHPKCVLTIDGTPVSGLFLERLVSVTITDKEGTRSDTIDITLEAGPPFLAIPRKKAIIRAWLGYEETGVAYFGAYTADDVTLDCLPYTLQVQGKSADMRAKMKEHKERHWDNKTVKDIVSEIAQENGLQAQVSGAVGAHKYQWFGQEGESGLHVVERLARRHNALFSVKDGKLIFAEKGSGLSAAGAGLTSLVITPPMIVKGTCKIQFRQRESHKQVRAAYHDQGEGKRQYAVADSDPDGEAVYTLRHQYANKDEAQGAASAKAKELQRSADSTSVTIEGSVAARGGTPMSYAGVHPEVDGTPFIIETATHTYSKGQGYRTDIQAKARK